MSQLVLYSSRRLYYDCGGRVKRGVRLDYTHTGILPAADTRELQLAQRATRRPTTLSRSRTPPRTLNTRQSGQNRHYYVIDSVTKNYKEKSRHNTRLTHLKLPCGYLSTLVVGREPLALLKPQATKENYLNKSSF